MQLKKSECVASQHHELIIGITMQKIDTSFTTARHHYAINHL